MTFSISVGMELRLKAGKLIKGIISTTGNEINEGGINILMRGKNGVSTISL